jgi:sugar/nucleoside kinase (ribokinase family)
MNLIDAERAELLYSRMGPAIEASGGSAGNTAAGIASFGGRSAYFGKVADDQLGKIFSHDIRAHWSVHFETRPLTGTPPTARSMIFVTPDGERSMNTYLGACVELGPEDVEADVVAGTPASPISRAICGTRRGPRTRSGCAPTSAHKHGREMSMTLSDPFCVDRYRERVSRADALGHNRHHVRQCGRGQVALPDRQLRTCGFAQMRKDCRARQRSPAPSMVRSSSGVMSEYDIDAIDIDEVVDTTGAGDLYAAGFLHGYAHGKPLDVCGRLGSLAAGLVIQQIGPRPQLSLKDAAAKNLA